MNLIKRIKDYKGKSKYILRIQNELEKGTYKPRRYSKEMIKTALENPTLPVGERVELELKISVIAIINKESRQKYKRKESVIKVVGEARFENYVIYIWSTAPRIFEKFVGMRPGIGDVVRVAGTVSGKEETSIRLSRINIGEIGE